MAGIAAAFAFDVFDHEQTAYNQHITNDHDTYEKLRAHIAVFRAKVHNVGKKQNHIGQKL